MRRTLDPSHRDCQVELRGSRITMVARDLHRNDIAPTERVAAVSVERVSPGARDPECDLVANGVVSSVAQSWLYDGAGLFLPDNAGDASLTRAELEAQLSSPDDRITLMCVPWGAGQRIAIDRDMDGVLNGD